MLHPLSYFVEQDIAHLDEDHGLDPARLRDLLASHGVAMFFSTIRALHRWDHELDYYRERKEGPGPKS